MGNPLTSPMLHLYETQQRPGGRLSTGALWRLQWCICLQLLHLQGMVADNFAAKQGDLSRDHPAVALPFALRYPLHATCGS